MRLTKSWEFRLIKKMGCRHNTSHFVLLVMGPACSSQSRIGITVSKKIGNAVVRNKHKRLIRNYFRTHKSSIKHRDFVIIVRCRIGDLSNINSELDSIFSRV